MLDALEKDAVLLALT